MRNRLLLCATLLLLTLQPANARELVKVEAVPGIPFGVARITIPLAGGLDRDRLETHLLSVTDDAGRVLYPAIRYTQPMGFVRELLGVEQNESPSQLQIHFLFTGTDPLQVQLALPDRRTVTVIPNTRPIAYKRLLRMWWLRYKAAARKQRIEGDYPPIIETYLTSMLARRLHQADEAVRQPEDGETLAILLGTEKQRLAMLQETVTGKTWRDEPLEYPVPEAIRWPQATVPEIAVDDVAIEDIARYVPRECFYVRFAQFANYLWLRNLLEEYGGDLSRMVLLRGTDSQLNSSVENQLGLRSTSLAEFLGPQVISDVAMIGRDTYLQEGAALGILFEAKNRLLKTELLNQRKLRIKELKEAGIETTLETIEIDGTKVSFARTEDNQLRSFQVQADKYHLVTNCREIARRFIACSKDPDAYSLGASSEFRYARSLIPLGEENTLFLYFSRPFFEGLLSPQYQIELRRRLRSVTDHELMLLATRAAIAEGHGGEPVTMDKLVQYGFLGSRVDRRADGSTTKVVEGELLDSVRGRRGTFLPVPDTPIENITVSEARRFRQTAMFHEQHWRQMDPVLIGLQRSALDDETERVEIDARMLPINREKYGSILNVFGPPTETRIRPLEDDIISVQAHVDGGNLSVAPHQLYFGIRDAAPKKEYSERRFLKSLQIFRTAPAYVAAWPRPGVLEAIGLGGRPLGNGYHRMLLGLLRLDVPGGFSLLSFDPAILSEVAPQLQAENVDDRAQLRVQVGNIMESNFGEWANDLDYQRAWETSVGNVHLMHVLTQQLRVPMADARTVAERVLNAELICPLGGDYQLVQNDDGTQRWSSTAWVNGKRESRENYVSPLMSWLRGLEAAVTIEDGRVVAKGALDIKRAKMEGAGGGIKLPLFNFFGGKKTESKQPPKPERDAPTEAKPSVGAKPDVEELPAPNGS